MDQNFPNRNNSQWNSTSLSKPGSKIIWNKFVLKRCFGRLEMSNELCNETKRIRNSNTNWKTCFCT